MKIRFAVVAAASALAALPGWGADIQVGSATSISISGFLGVGLKSADITSTNRAGISTETRVDDNTSRIYFSGASKITDGWSGIFQIGSRFTADVRPGDTILNGNALTVSQGSGWADDDTWVGIASPWGKIVMGKTTFYWNDTIGLPNLSPALDAPGECYRVWDSQGLSSFNILDQAVVVSKANVIANVYTLGITRERNTVRFDSKNWSGTDFSLAWSKNPAGGENWYPGVATPNATYARNYESGNTFYGRVRYNGNGFSLLASALHQQIQGGVYVSASYTGPLDTDAFRLGASYRFPMGLKVGLVLDQTTIKNGAAGGATQFGVSLGDAKRTAWEVPVSYAFGDHMFHLTYAKAGNVASSTATGANQLNFVYDYALTKRAFIGFVFTNLKNDTNGHYNPFLTNYSFGASASNPAGVNGEGYRQFGINMQYWF
jgi:predicted porin